MRVELDFHSKCAAAPQSACSAPAAVFALHVLHPALRPVGRLPAPGGHREHREPGRRQDERGARAALRAGHGPALRRLGLRREPRLLRAPVPRRRGCTHALHAAPAVTAPASA